MAKNLKLNIKNTQLAKVAGLEKLKERLEKKPPIEQKPSHEPKATDPLKKDKVSPEEEANAENATRIRAKSKSSFAPKAEEGQTPRVQRKPLFDRQAPVSDSSGSQAPAANKPEKERLGPTGRHVKDLLKKANEQKEAAIKEAREKKLAQQQQRSEKPERSDRGDRPDRAPRTDRPAKPATTEAPKTDRDDKTAKPVHKGKSVRDFKDVKPAKHVDSDRDFDARDRAGLRAGEDEGWRKRRGGGKSHHIKEEETIRPSSLKIKLPITIKDLAAEMKYKASELVQKLFLQNMIFTLNDYLEDETLVQYLGQEFGCDIKIDTTEDQRIQITSDSIAKEIEHTASTDLVTRPPIVAFMGHVDHGKTSLIDAIRKSNRVAGEAGAITQHMGAFMCHTAVGDITVLDTPGHEAFSAMRARGAEVTDIVVLVVAGDEGLKEQTKEAVNHAKSANVTIVVAINKCDKPNFNAENVYRQLSEIELLPEAWGGQTITINTSAVTGEGIKQLLEMLALQAEVLELKANPHSRARGTVLESELHKGLGCVATVLVQNGTLNYGDAIVFERHYGRVKTMQNEYGRSLKSAGPSHPVELTGLSGLPAAGDPFIVVKSEKEAKHIVEQREIGHTERQLRLKKTPNLDNLFEQKSEKKILNLLIRGDVQGSVEALKTSIMKIQSTKAAPNIVYTGVGEVSESDVQLAAASNAVILAFHTGVEPNAANLLKEHGVTIRQHNIIYHAIDDVKRLMKGLLDKIVEEKQMGVAEVRAVFKSSQVGNIAGCMVTEGHIIRNNQVRVLRGKDVVWKGTIASLKRGKEDVKEIKKDFECGIVLQGFDRYQVGDLLQAYELIYHEQEL